MSNNPLAQQLMALPLAERVDLAQALWESIDEGFDTGTQQEAVAEAVRRDSELTSGAVVGRSHEDVMHAARRLLGCD